MSRACALGLLLLAGLCALGCRERSGSAGATVDASIFVLSPLGLDDAGTGPSADDVDTAAGRVRRARADLERVLAIGRPAEGKLACELGLATSLDLTGPASASAAASAAAERDKLGELCVRRIYPAALRADLARIKAAAAGSDDVAFHCDKDRDIHDVVAAAGREADLAAAFAAACKQRW